MVQKQQSPLLTDTAFQPETLSSDLERLVQYLSHFLASVPTRAWSRPTEKHQSGWTMHETLAHVTAMAELYLEAIEKSLSGERFARANVTRREELPALIRQDIDMRRDLTPIQLTENLLRALQRTSDIIPSLSVNDLSRPTSIAFFDRPPAIVELVGAQLTHIAIVHGFQLTAATSSPPLWHTNAPDLLQRHITRFLQMVSFMYWREREPDFTGTINYVVNGPAGGKWALTLTPQGAYASTGNIDHPALTIWHPSAQAMCACVTKQMSTRRSLVLGRMMVWGNLGIALRLHSLLSPA